MSLRKELQDRWTTTHDISTRWQAKVDELVNELRDLETAIAALTPAPDFTAEKETAREQLEREPEIPAGFTKWEGGECPVDPDARVSVMFLDGEISHDGVIAGNMNWAHDATCAVRIYAYRVTEQASAQEDAFSFVAQSPVVRPVPGTGEESRDQSDEGLGSSLIAMGYGDDEAPALNADMQDEREQPYRITADVDDKPLTIDFETIHEATECMEELKLRSTANAELSVLHEGENGEQERVTLSSFAEAAPEPDAPVTNPEADFWSRGLASEQKPERKFDPFAMFKREDA